MTTRERRRLVKFGKGLGPAIKELITIVTPRTFARWLSGGLGVSNKPPLRKPGRPRTADEVRDLILCLARETGWGYTCILRELKKLVVRECRSTIVAILKEHGLDPGPMRDECTWTEFVRRHAEALWACDFFSKKVWTMGGLADVFVLLFIHVKSRQVHVACVTANPDETWVVQQARNVSMFFGEQQVTPVPRRSSPPLLPALRLHLRNVSISG